jgi:UV radiation resistance-associated gene protein
MVSLRWLVPGRESLALTYLLGDFLTASRFPLYAKGVDTYRFEYGVFLLNKNIELVSSSPG